MNDQGRPAPTPKAALTTTRIIWAALLMGQVIFLIVAMAIRQEKQGDPSPGRMLGLIAVVLVVSLLPVGYFLRGMLYGPNRLDNRVEPQRYLSANIVFLALFEGPSLLGIVAFLLTAQPWPALLATGIAMIVQALNFPTGSAMGTDVV